MCYFLEYFRSFTSKQFLSCTILFVLQSIQNPTFVNWVYYCGQYSIQKVSQKWSKLVVTEKCPKGWAMLRSWRVLSKKSDLKKLRNNISACVLIRGFSLFGVFSHDYPLVRQLLLKQPSSRFSRWFSIFHNFEDFEETLIKRFFCKNFISPEEPIFSES